MLPERRRGPRIVPEGMGWISHEGIFLRTRIVNLSVTGALVEEEAHALPIGATVTFRCRLGPGEVEVEGDAIVRDYRVGGLMAIEFQNWPAEGQRKVGVQVAGLVDIAP